MKQIGLSKAGVSSGYVINMAFPPILKDHDPEMAVMFGFSSKNLSLL